MGLGEQHGPERDHLVRGGEGRGGGGGKTRGTTHSPHVEARGTKGSHIMLVRLLACYSLVMLARLLAYYSLVMLAHLLVYRPIRVYGTYLFCLKL